MGAVSTPSDAEAVNTLQAVSMTVSIGLHSYPSSLRCNPRLCGLIRSHACGETLSSLVTSTSYSAMSAPLRNWKVTTKAS